MFILLTRENDGGAILWKNPLSSCPFLKLCSSRLTSFHVNLLVVRSHPLQKRVLYFTLKQQNFESDVIFENVPVTFFVIFRKSQ